MTDSCIDSRTGEPAALEYFSTIGVNPDDAVPIVVATHWDDDHIRGLARIVAACRPARFVCSGAIRRQELLTYVFSQGFETVLGSGVDEIRGALRSAKENGGEIVWGQARMDLHPVPSNGGARIRALSPSADAVDRALIALGEEIADEETDLRRRFKAPEGPNGASVVTEVEFEQIRILLGADLENSNNQATGWDAVLADAQADAACSAFKVAHHGSEGAHHDGVWAEMLEDQPLAILTPWARAGRILPLDNDVARLKERTDEVYLTALPEFQRVKKDSQLERLVRRLHRDQLSVLEGWGHVRARKGPTDDTWQVELAGDAMVCE